MTIGPLIVCTISLRISVIVSWPLGVCSAAIPEATGSLLLYSRNPSTNHSQFSPGFSKTFKWKTKCSHIKSTEMHVHNFEHIKNLQVKVWNMSFYGPVSCPMSQWPFLLCRRGSISRIIIDSNLWIAFSNSLTLISMLFLMIAYRFRVLVKWCQKSFTKIQDRVLNK